MQMTAVYSCVRILSEAIAGLPIHLYRYGEGGSKEKAINHPLYFLLHDTLIPFYLIFFMVFSPKYSEKQLNCTTYFDLPDFLAPFWHRRILKPILFCRY